MRVSLLSALCAALLCGPAIAQTPLITSAIPFRAFVGDVAIDDVGNAYVTGFFNRPVTFGTTTLNHTLGSPSEGFVAKLSMDGEWLWAKRFGSEADLDWGLAIACLPQGGVAIATAAGGGASLVYDGQTIPDIGEDALVIYRLTEEGVLLGHAVAGGGLPERLVMAVGHDGSCYVGGELLGPHLDLGVGVVSGPYCGFLAALSPTNEWSWVRGFEGAYYAEVTDLMIDPAGELVVLGDFTGPFMHMEDVVFTGFPMVDNVLTWTTFVMKLHVNGNVIWIEQNDPAIGWGVSGIHLGLLPDNNYRVCGWFWEGMGLGNHSLIEPGNCYMASLTPDGEWVYLASFPLNLNVHANWVEDPGCTLTNGDYIQTACAITSPYTIGDWEFVPGTGTSGIIAQADSAGEWVTAQVVPSAVTGIIIGVVGNAVRTLCYGQFKGETDFGPTMLTTPTQLGFIADIGAVAQGYDERPPDQRAVEVFPIPTPGTCTVVVPGHTGRSTLLLMDACGRTVLSSVLIGERTEIDVAALPSGIYMIKVDQTTARLVKE